MQKITYVVFLVTALAVSLISCKKEDKNEIVEEGSIAGIVRLYDDKTNLSSSASGVTVSVIGMPNKTAITSADGKFTISGLPFDNYDLSFSKTGYGTYKIFGIDHRKQSNTSAGSTSVTQLTRTISLGAVSGTSITALTAVDVTYNDSAGIEYGYSVAPEPSSANRGYIRAFVGKKHTTSSTEYLAFSNVKSILNNNSRGGFLATELYGFGFQSGDSVYVKLYGDSFNSNSYTDPVTGNTVFPNLNAVSAAAVGFIVP
jgi:hypothetical protein